MQKDEIIYDVLGIGNAIVDVLAKVGDGFLTERGLSKGSMTLLGAREAGEIYRDIIPEGEVSCCIESLFCARIPSPSV